MEEAGIPRTGACTNTDSQRCSASHKVAAVRLPDGCDAVETYEMNLEIRNSGIQKNEGRNLMTCGYKARL